MSETDQVGDAEEQGEANDDASRFGGEHTGASDTLSPAESWDRDAEDIDALLSPADRTDAGQDGSDGDPR